MSAFYVCVRLFFCCCFFLSFFYPDQLTLFTCGIRFALQTLCALADDANTRVCAGNRELVARGFSESCVDIFKNEWCVLCDVPVMIVMCEGI